MRKKILTDIKGAVVIEFVFILPVMAIMFLGAIEYSRAFFYQTKVNKVSGVIGDIISSSDPINTTNGNNDVIARLGTDCKGEPYMLTINRLKNNILNDRNMAVLLAPLDINNMVVYVTSIYQPTTGLARVAWKYSYAVNPNLTDSTSPKFLFASKFPAVNKDVSLVMPPMLVNGVNVGMFSGESIIAVEVGIKYKSLISGNLAKLIPPVNTNMVGDTVYYSARKYVLNSSGKPREGLNYLWPTILPNSTTNPNGC